MAKFVVTFGNAEALLYVAKGTARKNWTANPYEAKLFESYETAYKYMRHNSITYGALHVCITELGKEHDNMSRMLTELPCYYTIRVKR